MSILVIAEHDNVSIKPSTLNTVAAAAVIATLESQPIHILVAGHKANAAVEAAAQIPGISKVIAADAQQLGEGLAEDLADTIVQMAGAYSHILAPSTAFGRNVAPRVAALLDVAQVSDVIAVKAPDVFERPTFAGNVIATVQAMDAIKVMTIRTTAFDPVLPEGGNASVEHCSASPTTGKASFVGRELTKLDRPELTSAQVIVSGGRGLGSQEKYQAVLAPLADKLGAALGASRAAVDAGFAPNDYQVGQTGKIVAPSLYVAIGISGAIQHLAGMKDSKVIVAINKDPEAPIFSIADYGLADDLFEAVPALQQAL
jgi:electron transfer flavoprotein alpha subunit